ncbi:MAG: MoxR family ATPase [Bacteroidota bacterium]|nr:MoxR family ATPase [Bacteroidota bacterium]
MEENVFQNRVDLSELQQAVARIKQEVNKIIVGQDEMIELLIAAILADGHVLIEGVPGVAKTLAAKLLSRTMSVGFSRIQFTPDLMPSDIIGTSVYNLKTSDFEFKQGPLFSHIILIDEINRAPAKTQSALFEAMEERQITVDGKTYPLEAPFIVLATQNPVEQEGTYRLPEAQLDRFVFKIEVDYPTLEQETKIIADYHSRRNTVDITLVNSVMNATDVKEYRNKVSQVHIDANLISYIAKVVNQTRNNTSLYLGASPRASLSILSTAKAIAAMRGRDFVTPDDIKFVATPVLKHRVMLTPEKEMEGLSTNDVVKQIIEKIEIPR